MSANFSNSWARKVVDFNLIVAGFKENTLLSTYTIYNLHCFMGIACLIYACLEICGIFVIISTQKFRVLDLLMRIQYLLFLLSSIVIIIIYTFKKHHLQSSIENVSATLHCFSWMEEAPVWQKNQRKFELFVLFYMVTVYSAGCLTSLLSLIRLVFLEGIEFIAFPVWYPVDVFESQLRLWIASLIENMMVWYTVFLYSSCHIIFLYLEMTIKVGLNALADYLEMIANPVAQIKSEEDLRVGEVRKIHKYSSSERLKAGIEDLNILRRKMKLANKAFELDAALVHSLVIITNALSGFAAIYELRKSGKPDLNGILFFLYFLASISYSFLFSYLTTMLEDAYEKLLNSLRENEWSMSGKEFKKLFLLSEMVLKQSYTIKAYAFLPINFRTFIVTLKQSWSFFLFLYQTMLKR